MKVDDNYDINKLEKVDFMRKLLWCIVLIVVFVYELYRNEEKSHVVLVERYGNGTAKRFLLDPFLSLLFVNKN